MLEGLTWLGASVGAFCVLVWLLPRSISTSVTAWRQRNVEPATASPPSAVCPQCAGTWGKWSAIIVDHRPNDPSYPMTGGSHEVRSQTRTCTECGWGERRVLG